MPVYLCASMPGTIPQHLKQPISKTVTEIHCHATGAPPNFVHVFFFDEDKIPMLQVLWGNLDETAPVQLYGNIRSGRTDDTKNTIITGLRHSVAELLQIAISDVSMATRDIDAKWVMEGGELLPEPGGSGLA